MSTHPAKCLPCDEDKCPGKLAWPELVGKTGAEAKAIIEKENPRVSVKYISCGEFRNHDCCCGRVWLEVEEPVGGDYANAKVCVVPRVG